MCGGGRLGGREAEDRFRVSGTRAPHCVGAKNMLQKRHPSRPFRLKKRSSALFYFLLVGEDKCIWRNKCMYERIFNKIIYMIYITKVASG